MLVGNATTLVTSNYRRQLKIRLALMVVVFLWGVLAIALSSARVLRALRDAGLPVHTLSPSMQSFYAGFGAGFTAAAGVFVLLHIYLLLNKKRQERQKVRDLDERNVMIKQKSMTMAGALAIVVAAFGAIVAGVFNTAVMFTLIGVIFFIGLAYLASLLVYRVRT